MGLPTRVQRAHATDPLDIVRQDFNTLLRGFFTDGGDGGSQLASLSNYGVDVREDADRVYVEADLPGFRKEDVDISLEGGVLTITAERREEDEIAPGQQAAPGKQGQAQGQEPQQGQGALAKGDYLLHERRYRRFVRSFVLPPNVDESSVQARLENGVLKITLNKREESKPKKIQVA